LEFARVIYQPSFNDAPKVSRGYGFVKYVNEENTHIAIKELNSKEHFGKNCRIEISKRPCPRDDTPGQYLGVRRD
jgi:RNA recognition motif-containing protein